MLQKKICKKISNSKFAYIFTFDMFCTYKFIAKQDKQAQENNNLATP